VVRPGVGAPALALWVAVLLLAPGLARAGVEITMDVSPTAGAMTDTYVVTIRLDISGVSGPERFFEPSFEHFEVVDRHVQPPSTSMSFDPRRGQEIRTHQTRRYVLRPTRPGRIRIEPASVQVRGQIYETRGAVVEVGSARADLGAPDEAGAGVPGVAQVPGFQPPDRVDDDDVFLHAVADRREVYVGEQVIVTWLLYARSDVLRFEPQVPSLDLVWSEILHEPDTYFTYHDTRVGGRVYTVAIVSKRALFPTRPGTLEIEPFRARVTTLESPLDAPLVVESDRLALEVQGLPEGAPADFDPSYVGRYEVEASVDRATIDAGESFTLALTVRGEGAIRRTSPPRLDLEGFDVRVPRDFEQTVEAAEDRVRGERVYRYWMTPLRGGEQVIPAIELSYFDPTTATFERTRTDPIPVEVIGDPSLVAAADGDGEAVMRRDIRLIREGTTISSRTSQGLFRLWWYWLIVVAPPLLYLALVVRDRVRERLRRETPRSRLRRARGRAQRRFRVAEIHLRGQRPAQFFGELTRVIHEHIEERVGRPVHSLTRVELKRYLHERGVPRQTVDALDRELESFDVARFSPSASGAGEMRQALKRTRDLLREIEKAPLTELDAMGREDVS
jgi:hypothetical protein